MEDFYDKMTGVFSGQKSTNNIFLNLIGLHVFRILVGRLFYKIRSRLLFSEFTKDQEILRKDGIVIIKNFFPDKKFKEIKKEFENAKNYDGVYSETIDGDSIWTRHKFNRTQLKNLPNTSDLLSDSRVLELIRAGEARNITPEYVWFDEVSYPEKKTKGNHEAANTEKLHIDVFYHAHKAMYFMNDVKDEDGPFNFSPKTHHLFLKRLWFEYKKSVTNSDLTADEKEVSFLGLKNIFNK